MSQVTALIADTSTVGYVGVSAPSTTYDSGRRRRNPQDAVARIRTVMNPHIVQEVPGGMVSADFTVPAEEAQRWRPMLRYGAYCWLFDGQTPIFMGQIEQPSWTDTGDAQINVSGPWIMLGRSRMYEFWEFRDMAQMPSAAGNVRNASTTVKSDGTLELSFNRGETLSSGDRVAVEFAMPVTFGESNFKQITGFEVHISDAGFNSNANLVFRVQAITGYGSSGTTLYSSTTTGTSNRQTANDVFSENTGGTWTPTNGLRFGLFSTASITAGGAARVGIDRIRITTREAIFPSNTGSHDTAAIARDMLNPRDAATSSTYDLQEPWWPSDHTTTGTTAVVKYGRDSVTGTGTAPNSGVGITGFNIPDFTSPAEILLNLASIDGYHVGFYLPYNQRGGYDAGNAVDGARSLWLSARPQLFYQAWPDPTENPDYTIHVREGAQVEQDPNQSQGMLNWAYAKYSTLRGLPQNAFIADGNEFADTLGLNTQGLNYLTNQGFNVAEDWTIDSSVDLTTAELLASQMMQVRRQPFASSTVTITNDGLARFPILKAGAQVPHLSQVRPGSVRLVDVPGSSGLRQGYATRVEWWGATLNDPEHIEITLSDPGQMLLERRLGWAGLRANRQRVSGG